VTSAGASIEGLTVVVTRARHQARELSEALEALGANVIELPVISTVEPPDWTPADRAISDLQSYDWVLFTSANAVRCFIERLESSGLEISSLGGIRIAAVGTSTAACLERCGLKVDLTPERFVAEGLIESLEKVSVGEGSRILLPRALEAREILPQTLRAMGAIVDVVPVYRTVVGEGDSRLLARLAGEAIDVITFTSPSTVRGFLKLASMADASKIMSRATIAAIGPVTSQAVLTAGYRVGIQAQSHSVRGLVQAIKDWADARMDV